MKVLNVGGNDKTIPLPSLYDGWEHKMLDIDPSTDADYICDARDMSSIKEKFESIYCSHNLEHFYQHDVPKVLAQFKKVLHKDGFVFIKVPDLATLMKRVVDENLDIEDRLYTSYAGDVSALDMLYGYQVEIKSSGQDWFAHKIGFTPKTLRRYLEPFFKNVFIKQENLELIAIASNKFNQNPFE